MWLAEAEAIVPALNEEMTVGSVVRALLDSRLIRRVIVVDNGSTDDTAAEARWAGAHVIDCRERGLGRVIKRGLLDIKGPRILKTDADITNWNPEWVRALLPTTPRVLHRLVFDSPYDDFPVTRLVAEPLLRRVLRGEPPPRALSGTYAFHRDLLDWQSLSDDWSFDIAVLCAALEEGVNIVNVDIGLLSDRVRPIDHYVPMASQIIDYILRRYGVELLE